VRLTLGLAGVLLLFASSRANAQEACDPSAWQPEVFTNAVGECDEPGISVETPIAPPQRAPVECDGASCLPQPAPLDSSGGFAVSFTNPLAVLGTTLSNPEPSTFLVTNETGGPRAGFCLRIDRPPKRQ
jgi:hypothetical protein